MSLLQDLINNPPCEGEEMQKIYEYFDTVLNILTEERDVGSASFWIKLIDSAYRLSPHVWHLELMEHIFDLTHRDGIRFSQAQKLQFPKKSLELMASSVYNCKQCPYSAEEFCVDSIQDASALSKEELVKKVYLGYLKSCKHD